MVCFVFCVPASAARGRGGLLANHVLTCRGHHELQAWPWRTSTSFYHLPQQDTGELGMCVAETVNE
eukprot:2017444-Pleurochrysis_carterae.AAC.1